MLSFLWALLLSTGSEINVKTLVNHTIVNGDITHRKHQKSEKANNIFAAIDISYIYLCTEYMY